MIHHPDTYRVSVKPVTKTASGVIYAGACFFHGFLVGTDGTNDPSITLYDNASAASGQEIIPTTTFDASALGLNGVTGVFQYCSAGIYLSITAVGGGAFAGACEVSVLYAPCPIGVDIGSKWK